jgi:DNA-binding response OmpR family regulator
VQWLVLCLDADPACTLLLVDPSPAMAARYSRTLRRGGFEVTSTESLDIALDLIRTVAFDLVIVDTHLGGADGRALLPHLPDTPVIVLSHLRADPLLQLECQALGAAAIYAKPLHPDRLLEAAERVLAIAPRGLSPADPSTARSLALFENRTHLSREEHARLATEDGPPETLAAMRAHLSVCSACRTHHRSHTVGSHTPPRSPTA